jgi:hypothetical protein
MAVDAFHLHVNALSLSAEGQRVLQEIGFEERHFKAGELGQTHFVPKIHLANHQRSSAAFKSLFARARAILMNDEGFLGYIEGEYVTVECTVASRPLNDGSCPFTPSPFVVLFQNARKWREAEIHVSLPEPDASIAIRQYFADRGFYSLESGVKTRRQD